MKLKNKKVTKPRHPEMVSYGDALDIPTNYVEMNMLFPEYYATSLGHL